jgi:hypothetical protein
MGGIITIIIHTINITTTCPTIGWRQQQRMSSNNSRNRCWASHDRLWDHI